MCARRANLPRATCLAQSMCHSSVMRSAQRWAPCTSGMAMTAQFAAGCKSWSGKDGRRSSMACHLFVKAMTSLSIAFAAACVRAAWHGCFHRRPCKFTPCRAATSTSATGPSMRGKRKGRSWWWVAPPVRARRTCSMRYVTTSMPRCSISRASPTTAAPSLAPWAVTRSRRTSSTKTCWPCSGISSHLRSPSTLRTRAMRSESAACLLAFGNVCVRRTPLSCVSLCRRRRAWRSSLQSTAYTRQAIFPTACAAFTSASATRKSPN
mmetsp:Transcript_7171/g.18687  ORF Transcript_7171/g.18687 Transcript_7171/m.18687 type:complete len:265 (-) Transcript_7171:513-1307(-)